MLALAGARTGAECAPGAGRVDPIVWTTGNAKLVANRDHMTRRTAHTSGLGLEFEQRGARSLVTRRSEIASEPITSLRIRELSQPQAVMQQSRL